MSLLGVVDTAAATVVLQERPATPSPAPEVYPCSDDVVFLCSASPAVASTEASCLAEPKEVKPIMHPADAILGVCGEVNTSLAGDDWVQSGKTKKTLLSTDAGSMEAILGDPSSEFQPLRSKRMGVALDSHQTVDHEGNTSNVGKETENNGAEVDISSDTTRGKAIQDKYSLTSQWVKSLPRAGSVVITSEPVYTAGSETTPLEEAGKDKKRRRKESTVREGRDNGSEGERKRRTQEKAEAAELQAAFKHSHRVLRKQAKSVNMREVFARTFSLPTSLQISTDTPGSPGSFPPHTLLRDTSANKKVAGVSTPTCTAMSVLSPPSTRLGSSVFSHSSLVSPSSPSNSSGWSPGVAGELTTQFLTNLQQQRRKKFEQIISRELTQTQTRYASQDEHTQSTVEYGQGDRDSNHSPLGRTEKGVTNAFTTPVDELVIAEEDNEAANWMPRGPFSPASQNSRRAPQVESGVSSEMGLLGDSASQEGRLASFPITFGETQKAEEEEASQHEEKVVRSLARKHEIWKLRQRHLRAQEQVELDVRAKAMQQSKLSKPVASLPSSSPFSVSSHVARGNGESFPATTGKGFRDETAATVSDVLHASQTTAQDYHRQIHGGGKNPTTTVSSIVSSKLSRDDISMIRRINSFENTSAQRVVVFDTATSKQKGATPKL